MVLPREYPAEDCPIARSLEIVGERWTLLILREAFRGRRRFTDFQDRLAVPKAVLSQRLSFLVNEHIFDMVITERVGRAEYELTSKGRQLLPVLTALAEWGAEHYDAAYIDTLAPEAQE